MHIFVHASWIISMLEMLSHQKRKKKKQTIVLEPSGPEWSCIFNPPHRTPPCLLQYCLTLRRLNQQSIAVKIRSPFKDNNVNTNEPCDFFLFFMEVNSDGSLFSILLLHILRRAHSLPVLPPVRPISRFAVSSPSSIDNFTELSEPSFRAIAVTNGNHWKSVKLPNF